MNGVPLRRLIQVSKNARQLPELKVENVRNVRIYRHTKDESEEGYIYQATAKSRKSPWNPVPRLHTCTIETMEKKVINSKNVRTVPVRVSCSCEFFMYTCEYALTMHGASTIMHSNGKPAKYTNPGNVPLLCKHLMKFSIKLAGL